MTGRTDTAEWAPVIEAEDAIEPLDRRILNEFQRDFPLVARPYAVVAAALGLGERELLARLGRLVETGRVARVGPVLAPGAFGASTLAAMAVPVERLEAVARTVSAHDEVNHNYEREDAVNLWFVVTAATSDRVAAVLGHIAGRTGLPVLDLPMLRSYHIDLGFELGVTEGRRRPREPRRVRSAGPAAWVVTEGERRLAAAMTAGIGVCERPFQELALRTGLDEEEVLARIAGMVASGAIRRFGVVVRHRELGYRANAMTVWNVPDSQVDALGGALAGEPDVTLCYRRRRGRAERPGGPALVWPYNLYCMVHGQSREGVLDVIDGLCVRHGLGGCERRILFSRVRFKQRGARYGRARPSAETG